MLISAEPAWRQYIIHIIKTTYKEKDTKNATSRGIQKNFNFSV